MSTYLVPFEPGGSLMHYAGGYPSITPDWRPNEPFEARLVINGTRSGRSAKYFIWSDTEHDSREHPMFAADMVDLLCRATIEPGGIVHARWIVRKRGSNYGIAFHRSA